MNPPFPYCQTWSTLSLLVNTLLVNSKGVITDRQSDKRRAGGSEFFGGPIPFYFIFFVMYHLQLDDELQPSTPSESGCFLGEVNLWSLASKRHLVKTTLR